MKQLIIIGASGHGKVVADIAKKSGYEDIAFLDDNEQLKDCGGYSVIGKSCLAAEYSESDFIVAIGNARIREKMQKDLSNMGINIATLIHPYAVIAEDVSIGKGTVVMAGVVINPGVVIGDGCIINTCSSIDHDCIIGDFVHISVGSHVAGTVHIGVKTWLGVGAIVSNNVNICHDCMIGAGTVVIKDICASGTYVGIPAQRLATEN